LAWFGGFSVTTIILIIALAFLGRALFARAWPKVQIDTPPLLLAAIALGTGLVGVVLLHKAVTGRAIYRTENVVLGVLALSLALFTLIGLLRYLSRKA
jgi:hypothetical protein